jgi:type IV secretion system protein VirB10
MLLRAVLPLASALLLAAQEPAVSSPESTPKYLVETGTKIPLSLLNSVSTRTAIPGDRLYLETTFPILVGGRIVIPAGSYVAGTVTEVRRAGRVKGRAELMVRFDSLTLPNGVTRDFRATISNLDGRAAETLKREEGTIKGESNKAGDAGTIAGGASAGAGVGALGGWAAGRPVMGAGIGAAAGATAGLIGVLMQRGPDAVLAKGSSVEMVLDRNVEFEAAELDFSGAPVPGRRLSDAGSGPLPGVKDQKRGTAVPVPGWPGARRPN